MAGSAPISDREVWIQAGAILAEHGEHTRDYIVDQMVAAIGDPVAVKDWHRIAAAFDVIKGTWKSTANC
jgi:class 3 adenylate cyclase